MARLTKLLPLASLMLVSVAAQADEGDWYVSPSIAYSDDDGDRLIDDSVAGGQIQVGREMTDKFWLEGLLGYHDIDGFPGQEHLEIGFNAIRNFSPDGLFSPYVIGGVGVLQADAGLPSYGVIGVPPAGESSTSVTLTAGLGTLINFGDSPWALRTEWRFRHAFDDESLTDQVVSLGIQYSFGGGSDMPAPSAPSEPEPVVVYTESPQVSPTEEVEDTIRFTKIYFGFDSDLVLPTARRQLDQAASVLKRDPDMKVEIAGFADSRGSDRYNMDLSQRRADAVHQHLVQAGVNAANLTVRAYGSSQADASDLSANNLAESRRVELRIQ